MSEHPLPIDLLLSDVYLSGSLGSQLAHEGQAHRAGMRVLYMSALGLDELIADGSVSACVAALRKPFSAAQLLAAVREALGAIAADGLATR